MQKVIKHFLKFILHFSDKPYNRTTTNRCFKELGHGVSEASSKSLQRPKRPEVVGGFVETVGKYLIARQSITAKFTNCRNNTTAGTLKEFGFMNMWPALMHHNLSSNHDRQRLQIDC